jgi:hypothetical protein
MTLQEVTENLMGYNLLQFVLFAFMNNILSGTKYRVSPEGVSLMDETNNLASHLGRSPLIHSYGYESAGDRPTCFARLPLNSKSFMQYAG